ncbi:MAG: acyltransferase [Dehalococcoidia bacterium]|nr:acyltransferase [Dehalococcoidia bacterium]
MRLAAKLAAVLALIIVASFAWSVVQTDTNPVWAFFSPLTRAWELALGSLLAVGVPQLRRLPLHLGPWLSWIGLTGVIGGAFVLDNGTAFPGYAAALPVAGTALVVAGGTIAPRGGAERLLALVPFQVLGKWSYSLYLWHWPVLIIAEQRAGQSLALAQNLGLVALGLGLAVITHYAIENPVRFARPLARNPWSSLSVGVCLVVAAYGLSAWQLGVHAPARPPVQSAQAAAPGLAQSAVQGLSADSREPRGDPVEEVLALVSASTAINELPGDLVLDLRSAATDFAWFLPAPDECLVDPEILESPPCIFGDPDGSRTVVLFGDSHAAQWLQALDDIGERMHWKVIMLGKAGVSGCYSRLPQGLPDRDTEARWAASRLRPLDGQRHLAHQRDPPRCRHTRKLQWLRVHGRCQRQGANEIGMGCGHRGNTATDYSAEHHQGGPRRHPAAERLGGLPRIASEQRAGVCGARGPLNRRHL